MEGDDLDEGFLALLEAAEAQALDQKRRKLTHHGGDGEGGRGVSQDQNQEQEQEQEQEQPNSTPQGKYIDALKGIKTAPWQQYSTAPSSKLTGAKFGSDNVSAAGGGGAGDTCFKCGKLGHWARDCVDSGAAAAAGAGSYARGFGGNEDSSTVEEKMCSCGLGACLVLTANTEKNPGRKFYRCPARKENGGCGFFEWCDNSSSTPTSAARYSASGAAQYSTPISSFPDIACPCGAGSCLILTAKTEKNMGQQFYRCPANQENSCGFFKWCSERSPNVGSYATTAKAFSSTNDPVNKGNGDTRGNSCYKCGQEGHWSRDCVKPSSTSSGRSTTSSDGCYKCGGSGHWARDCPGQDRKVGGWR